uniref:Si:ch73-379j16.2 n=1 Tax=Gouania willdenowi TaxID=441366 RepID=A0A8C5DPL2_GOUWI
MNTIRTYALTSNEHFEIDLSQNDEDKIPFLVLKKPLDREQKSKHSFRVTAVDGGKPPRSGTLNVSITVLDINDNRPTFKQDTYQIETNENVAVGRILAKVSAIDPDEGDNGKIEYSLSKALARKVYDIFELNHLSGEIKLKQSLDYEESDIYKLDIEASDKGTPPLIGRCRVVVKIKDVNDNSPEIEITSLTNKVFEDSKPGTVISLISVTDRDSGLNGKIILQIMNDATAELRYSIPEEMREGASVGNVAKDLGLDKSSLMDRRLRVVSGSKDAYFDVNPDNGALQVRKKIDREEMCHGNGACTIELKILVENPLEIHYVIVEITDINDNFPVFSENEQAFQIFEHATPGTRFELHNARDPDSGINTVRTYTITTNDLFDIEMSPSDEEKIPFLVLKKSLDREQKNKHQLLVTAIDGGKPPRSGTLNISITVLDMNDNPPKFSQDTYIIQIFENVSVGTIIAQLSAVDPDEGTNGEIKYSLSKTLARKVYDKFELDSLNGKITLKEPLDYEDSDMYRLDVQASDKGSPPLTSRCRVIVKIKDINDNAPEIESPLKFYLLENNIAGKSIFSLSAKDNDVNENAVILYNIARGGGPDILSFLNINSETGDIVALKSFDFEAVKTFQFQVVATDSGTPSLSSNVTVHVFILDQNDNAPVILYPVSSNGSAEGVEDIPRNVHAGHLVTKVRAYDIRTLRSFTETDEAEHKLLILVKDNGNVSLSATATVMVKVVEPKEAFAASDVQSAAKDDEDSDVTFYLMITLGAVSLLFVISIIVLIAMQCSKSTDYTSKYLQEPNYDGTLCHSIQYRSGDKRYMLVGPRMSIGSTIVPGSHANTLVLPDRRRTSEEVRSFCKPSVH